VGGGGGTCWDDISGSFGGASGAGGAVRIIWGGETSRSFPSTNVDVSTTYTNGQSESLN